MKREFTVSSRARFASVVITGGIVEDMVLSVEPADDRNNYEFILEWLSLGNDDIPSLRVKTFYDSFAAFAECADLFAFLATQHGKSIQPPELEAFLLESGWTEDKSYYPDAATVKRPRRGQIKVLTP